VHHQGYATSELVLLLAERAQMQQHPTSEDDRDDEAHGRRTGDGEHDPMA
jgi:hypothetical protein